MPDPSSQQPPPHQQPPQPTVRRPALTPRTPSLLGAADVRRLAGALHLSPTKRLGQNFVTDPGTVRRIVHEAGVGPQTRVVEVGPGLGSLTLGLLEAGAQVTAIEIDPVLAARLPETTETFQPQAADRLTVLNRDALTITPADLPDLTIREWLLVANLPYNVATPILLTLLERFDAMRGLLVMVQREVADRLTARPGSKIYGAPSVKLAWYGSARKAGAIGRRVFWPSPNVDSALVSMHRNPPRADERRRELVFRLIDAAFGQRRKTLRAALRTLLPSRVYDMAGIDASRRGETLSVDEFARLAACADATPAPAAPSSQGKHGD